MAVKIIFDSASDILPQQAEAWNAVHIPLKVRFGEQEYLDAVTLSHKEFYEKLIESDILPATSLISPAEFESVYHSVVSGGDTAVVITLSGKLSGTYQSAVLAARCYPGEIFVVDSESVSLGERILIMLALQLRDRGCTAQEITEHIEQEKRHIKVLALLGTLEYLKKGGRLSAAAAFAGEILSIKPVVTLNNGEICIAGKARGSRQANNLLRELIASCGGIDFNKPYCLAYSGLSDALLQKYIQDNADLWQSHTNRLPIATVGSVIGAHAGPGAIAVAFYEK